MVQIKLPDGTVKEYPEGVRPREVAEAIGRARPNGGAPSVVRAGAFTARTERERARGTGRPASSSQTILDMPALDFASSPAASPWVDRLRPPNDGSIDSPSEEVETFAETTPSRAPGASTRSERLILGAKWAGALLLAVIVNGALSPFGGERIAPGVRLGAIPVGGLDAPTAERVLQRRLAAASRRPLAVRWGHASWTFAPARSRASVDVRAAVRDALARTRVAGFLARVAWPLPGGGLHVDVRAPVTYRGPPLSTFIDRIARAVARPPSDASVRVIGKRLFPVPDRPGVAVDRRALAAAIDAAVASAERPPRDLRVPILPVRARVTTADLPARYRDYVVIRRGVHRLDYFHAFRLVRSYPIAVGMQGLETPAGLYDIQGKEVDPAWHVPDSAWAGDKAGETVPPGADNPIKARWMGFNGGAGIHGTDDVGSLGHDASHGCVRMSVPDVIDLYRRVPLHAPVRVD
jgi:lipoprotein-anchoring transpeptidase ErfK/SrfK